MERRLAAIFAADMVGYSRLIEADETGTLERQKRHRAGLIDPKIATHHGRIVKLTGDGMIAEFPSVVEAVQCAVSVQREMEVRETDVPEDRRIRYRVAVNLGDVIFDEGDVYGDGVNIAARLEALAEPGGVCISASVHEQIRGKLPLDLKDLGELSLKNISRQVRAYEIAGTAKDRAPVISGSGGAEPGDTAIDFSRFSRASIVILPFRNLGGAQEDCLGEGLRLSLHAVLIKLSGLFLLHTGAVEAYRGRNLSALEIGREIDVQYVVGGAVQRAGDRVRILVELTDVAAGQVIWAERLDRTLTDIFDFQDEVTREIVNAIGLELRGGEARRAFFGASPSAEALGYVHHAVSDLYRGTREDTAAARDWAQKLLALEPDSPGSHGLIAITHWRDAKFGWTEDRQAALDLAAKHAQCAIDAGDPEGIGHTIIGYVRLQQRRHDEALAASLEARSRRPSCPLSNGLLADIMRYCGDPDQAVLRIRDAMRLARNFPPWMATALAASLRDKGEIDASIQAASQAIRLFPEDLDSKVTLCSDHVLAGSLDAAQKVGAEICQSDPGFSVSTYLAGQPYRQTAALESLADSLKRAGLPE